jgi:hypothetical protein
MKISVERNVNCFQLLLVSTSSRLHDDSSSNHRGGKGNQAIGRKNMLLGYTVSLLAKGALFNVLLLILPLQLHALKIVT